MNCVFQLNAYQIENVAVARNEQFDPTLDAHTGDIAASIDIAPHKKNARKYRLTLGIQVKPTTKQEKAFFPYSVTIKGRAFFTFKNPCSRDEVDKMLHLNGASILYGLLRAQVAQITAQSVSGQFLLPTVNFIELAQKKTSNGSTVPTDSIIEGTRAVREKPASYGKKKPQTDQTTRRLRTKRPDDQGL